MGFGCVGVGGDLEGLCDRINLNGNTFFFFEVPVPLPVAVPVNGVHKKCRYRCGCW